ncbi:ABC transporter ATP-binding protein [Floricoccus penangensis]|uniref:ABC transporter ATP-binding protein n=1 Tax=Floricoccus penangensis TaxID=1859475 RepID=UPI00204155DB|nr:ABC transporter ATP-binding protein [Floricoccus penangensis]URZ86764.1 energy-coupling factor ABC transporter ATP-binding protein [Floricoccus penangensis]
MQEKIIEIENFSFRYNSQSEPTLKNINLDIFEGEKILIIGPSGSGKSTLGQALNGIIPNLHKGESEGKLLVNSLPFGSSIFDLSKSISTVLQDTDDQFIGLTVAEDIAFALENDEVGQEEMQKAVEFWANTVEIGNYLNKKPQELSGGQKQRVSLAGVLIDESPILLFDEPLANLDPKSGRDTIELIDKIHKETKATCIIIEHRLEDVLHADIDRIVLINDGQVLYNDSAEKLLSSNLLQENGLREPLYVSALKYAGIDVSNVKGIANINKLQLTEDQKKQLLTWSNEIKNTSQLTKKDELLRLADFSVSYGDDSILENVNLAVDSGQRVSIVGQNGAGKSTLVKAICNFISSQGKIYWKGQDISDENIAERASKIGFVMQNPNHMISQSMIFDEVALGLRLRNVDEDTVKSQVEETLKTCGLYEFRNWPISALSYGQKKRVTIASILVLEPELIILDEPTAGQDFKHYSEFMDFLDQLNANGNTIISITHDMHQMMEYSDRTLVLGNKTVLADKLPADVLTNEELIKEAHLKKTSLFSLAQNVGIKDEEAFIANFIKYEQERRDINE